MHTYNSTYFRTNIESTHGHEVEQLRKQYTLEDKEFIKKFLEAKKNFNLKSEILVQDLEEKGPSGKLNKTVSLSLSLSLSLYTGVQIHMIDTIVSQMCGNHQGILKQTWLLTASLMT